MSRGKKILDLALTLESLDSSESESKYYDPNKVIHILEDIQIQPPLEKGPDNSEYNPNIAVHVKEDTQLQYIELETIPDNLNYYTSKEGYVSEDIILQHQQENTPDNSEGNPNQAVQVLDDVQLQYIELQNTADLSHNSVYDVDNDNVLVTNENFIVIPSQFEIDPQKTANEQNQYPLENISNITNKTPSILSLNNEYTSPVKSIANLDPSHHHIVPDPPISDDSDKGEKLVPYSDSDSDSLSEINKSNKRRKRFEVDKKEWFAEKNKRRRESGKSYFGRDKNEDYSKNTKPKAARSLKPRCSCRLGKYSTLKCATINEVARQLVFEQFWNLTWGEKKTLINEWVTMTETVRPRNRKTKELTKRAKSFLYSLKVNNESIKVCRTMFLNTLDLGRWTVQNWKKNFLLQPPSILRRHRQSSEPMISKPKESLIKFLESLPVMESHYCRATSQKLYLLPEWKSKESLYQFYVDNWCKEKNVKALSICAFSNAFESKNLGLFRPKKDQCEKCACYKVGTVSREQHMAHIEKVKQAREEKDQDKNGDSYVFTVDLQAVLMAPKSNVSTLYYKTKLQVYNLCFFNLKNKDGFCFICNEVEGGLNAEEFASIWVDFLENKVIAEIAENENKTIIIYSDGCTYQNRNCILSNALLNIVMKHKNITIEQKFLEVGHTQMEADSMHSTIERYLKDKDINVPAEYVSIARHARKCPAPYYVQYLYHKYFKKFDNIQFYKSIRPGISKGDPKVTDIRALRYESVGSVLYKTWYKHEWQPLPQRRSLQVHPCEVSNLSQLHQNRRKITLRKFQDLQEIKKTLMSDYHKYYDDLPHE
ncbi:unnamed protein product [Diatraea saccharalis]|uniref:Uncharacterized protein n=1 Tax=Diatraea saccharalis TaxID=40085 RepID=A0A9N9QZI9_9NEOP|nr:unnamed protein product [Diatraea saccharalis]